MHEPVCHVYDTVFVMFCIQFQLLTFNAFVTNGEQYNLNKYANKVPSFEINAYTLDSIERFFAAVLRNSQSLLLWPFNTNIVDLIPTCIEIRISNVLIGNDDIITS